MTEPIHCIVGVEAPAERAFEVFTGGMGSWWPRAYSWSGEALESIGIEPREGGLLSERGPGGFRLDFGRVLAWEPPRRLVFSWQIAPNRLPEPNPSRASEVEVRFEADGDRTLVRLEHRRFERHGAGYEAYRHGMGSEDGWPWILARYAEAASRAPAAAAEPGLDLSRTYAFLEGPRSYLAEVTPTFWQELEAGDTGDEAIERIAKGEGWLVTRFRMTGDFANWEMHPEGDELLHMESGAIEVIFDELGGERRIRVEAGRSCLVPRGTWHRAILRSPGVMLALTWGRGTEHRPL